MPSMPSSRVIRAGESLVTPVRPDWRAGALEQLYGLRQTISPGLPPVGDRFQQIGKPPDGCGFVSNTGCQYSSMSTYTRRPDQQYLLTGRNCRRSMSSVGDGDSGYERTRSATLPRVRPAAVAAPALDPATGTRPAPSATPARLAATAQDTGRRAMGAITCSPRMLHAIISIVREASPRSAIPRQPRRPHRPEGQVGVDAGETADSNTLN